MPKSDEEWNDGLTQKLLWDDGPDQTPLWDCCHPCTYLCWMIQQGMLPADEQIMKTLDAYGYKTPGGFPDFDAMNREFARVRNASQTA